MRRREEGREGGKKKNNVKDSGFLKNEKTIASLEENTKSNIVA